MTTETMNALKDSNYQTPLKKRDNLNSPPSIKEIKILIKSVPILISLFLYLLKILGPEGFSGKFY